MSWDVEPWQAVEMLEQSDDVSDVQWQPVQAIEQRQASEPLDVQVRWLEPESYPVKQESSDLERRVNEYIVSDEDMATAHEWLARVDSMTQPQTQLATHTLTKPRHTLTAFWSWVTKPVQETGSRHSKQSTASDHSPRWYFVCERDDDEPESLQHLRYWYMQYSYAEGVTEWSEAAFMEWVQGLSDDELLTFANAGEQIALGNWQDHVNDATASVIDQTRESENRQGSSAIDYFVDAFRGLL